MTLSTEQKWIVASTKNKMATGQGRIACPFCSNSRTKKTEPCLSVNIDDQGVKYRCWHCSEEGFAKHDEEVVREIFPVKAVAGPLDAASLRFLNHRGITENIARKRGIFTAMRFSRRVGKEVVSLAFPYRDLETGGVQGVKYRCLEPKDFLWEGISSGLWGIERVDVSGFNKSLPVIICEGELDALSLTEAGVTNGLSVPNGATVRVKEGRVDPKDDKSFSFLWKAAEVLKKAAKIIIATDDDTPGRAMGEELARRLGRAKCWQIKYPDGCKDINDVLVKHGRAEVRKVIGKAKPWPVAGLYPANHYRAKIESLYKKGPGKGESTGFSALDDIYTISPGLCVVTGIPGSGKSELIDQLAFNIAMREDWKFAVCSFENPPEYHITKYIEKFTRKPFFEGPNLRVSKQEREEALDWVNDHFTFMDQSDGNPSTIDSILERAAAAVQRLGVRGLIIDPFNYITLKRQESETNEISDMLTRTRQFIAAYDCHVWFIAHPFKLYAEGGGIPVPTGYSIAGSASWFSKADVGLSIARPWMHSPLELNEFGDRVHSMEPDNTTEVHCWKVRFKWMGRLGTAKLEYNPVNGVYSERINWGEVAREIPQDGALPWWVK